MVCRYSKDVEIPFYHFATNPKKKALQVAAVNRKDWEPGKYSWICGAHFINGCKSDDPISVDYTHVCTLIIPKNPLKRKLVMDEEKCVCVNDGHK